MNRDPIKQVLLVYEISKISLVEDYISPLIKQVGVSTKSVHQFAEATKFTKCKLEKLIQSFSKIVFIVCPRFIQNEVCRHFLSVIPSLPKYKLVNLLIELCDVPEELYTHHFIQFMPGSVISRVRLQSAVVFDPFADLQFHLDSFPTTPVKTQNRNIIEFPSKPLPGQDIKLVFRVSKSQTQNSSCQWNLMQAEQFPTDYTVIISDIKASEYLGYSTVTPRIIPNEDLHNYYRFWVTNSKMLTSHGHGNDIHIESWLRLSNSNHLDCYTTFDITFSLMCTYPLADYKHGTDTGLIASISLTTQRTVPKHRASFKDRTASKAIESSSSSSDSLSEGETLGALVQLVRNQCGSSMTSSVPPIHKSGFLLKSSYNKIMTNLQQLGENAEDNFKQFYDYSTFLMSKFKQEKNVDGQIVVLTQICGVEHYKNNLDEADDAADKALALAYQSSNSVFLRGRANYYKSAVARKARLLGKAHDALEQSKQELQHAEPGEDTAEQLFNEARNDMSLAANMHDCPRSLRLNIRDKLNQSINHCMREPVGHCDNEIRRCLLNMAQTMLAWSTANVGKVCRNVTREDIVEAEKYIAVIKEFYWTDVTKRNELHIKFTESVLHFRKKEYHTAMQLAKETQKMAEKFQFTAEIKYSTDFIEHIKLQKHEWDRLHKGLLLSSRDGGSELKPFVRILDESDTDGFSE